MNGSRSVVSLRQQELRAFFFFSFLIQVLLPIFASESHHCLGGGETFGLSERFRSDFDLAIMAYWGLQQHSGLCWLLIACH